MVAPILSDLTPENEQLISQLIAIAPGSLANSTPPGWLDPNYVPRVNHGDTIVGVTAAFTALALIAVCLRIYTRTTQKERSLGLDDLTIIPAMGFAIVMEVFNVLDVYQGGAGKHSYDTTIDQFALRWRYQFILTTLYIITTTFVRFSIISFLRHLFNASIRWNYLFYVLYVCYFIMAVVAFFMNLIVCRPVSAIWNLREYAATGGHCRNIFQGTLAFCIIFALNDAILLVIPLVVVSKMNMRQKRKIATIFIFALGGLTCVFAIWKAAYLSAVSGSLDDSWFTIYVIIMSSLETNIAIFICCIPAMKTLHRRLTEKPRSYYHQQDNNIGSDKATKQRDDLDILATQSDNA